MVDPALLAVLANHPPVKTLPHPEDLARPAGEPAPPPARAEAVVVHPTFPPEKAPPPARPDEGRASSHWSVAQGLTALWLLGALAFLARALVRLLQGLPAKINLIPFNAWPGAPYECSDWGAIEAFAAIVNKAGYASPIRTPRGRDILAAAGQLRSESKKMRASERRLVTPTDL